MKMSNEQTIKELASRLEILETWIIEQDMTQEFEDYIDNQIKFHRENNNKFLPKNYAWDLELKMVKEFKSLYCG